jgi:hypothetical protein
VLSLALLIQKYYLCGVCCVCVCVWTCQTSLLALLPLLSCRNASCYHVSCRLNLAESVCVRHSPQEALHSICCLFHFFFSGKSKIRRMHKASVVYDLVVFVFVVLEILINSTSLTGYKFRVFFVSYSVFSEYCIGCFTILCPFLVQFQYIFACWMRIVLWVVVLLNCRFGRLVPASV